MGAILIVILLIGALIWVYLDSLSQKRRDNKLFDKLFEVTNDLELTKQERYLKMQRLCMNTKGKASHGAYMAIEAFYSMKDKNKEV